MPINHTLLSGTIFSAPSRMQTLAERIDDTVRSYAPERGTVAYRFAAQREAIAEGVEVAVMGFDMDKKIAAEVRP